MNVPSCPSCGAADWWVPSAVEIRVRVLGGRADHVEVDEPYTMDCEGDSVCAHCGELLLDWDKRLDDPAWKHYHDERRSAWHVLVRDVVPSLELPHPSTWTLRVPEPEEHI